jgi:hypothetical protein
MEMEVEPDSANEKNDFLNRQDMAIGSIFWSISPKIHYQVYDESRDSTPNELWTKLEVLFGNKKDCEYCMQEIEKIEPKEKPSEDRTSYSEESSTQVFVSSHFLFFYALYFEGGVSLFPYFFSVSFLYALYNGHLTWPMLS